MNSPTPRQNQFIFDMTSPSRTSPCLDDGTRPPRPLVNSRTKALLSKKNSPTKPPSKPTSNSKKMRKSPDVLCKKQEDPISTSSRSLCLLDLDTTSSTTDEFWEQQEDDIETSPRKLNYTRSNKSSSRSLLLSSTSSMEALPRSLERKTSTRKMGLLRMLSSSLRLGDTEDFQIEKAMKTREKKVDLQENPLPYLSRSKSVRQSVSETGGKHASRRRLTRHSSTTRIGTTASNECKENTKLPQSQKPNSTGKADTKASSSDRMERRGSVTKYSLDESLHRVQKELNASLGLPPPPPPAKGYYSPRYFPSPIESQRKVSQSSLRKR